MFSSAGFWLILLPMPTESKILILVRHAKSAWNTLAKTDFDRPLSKRGERDAPRMAQWLAGQGLKIERIISSPAERAQKTALAMARHNEVALNTIEWDSSLYMASSQALQKVAEQGLGEVNTLMLVGHNPGIEHCLLAYCPDAPFTCNGKLMTTANIAVIEFINYQAVQDKGGQLNNLKRPKAL